MSGPQNHREIRPVEQVSSSMRGLSAPERATLTLDDVYFTLFRHKWKIALCSLLGLAAAFAFYKISPRIYQSEAKLFIRYVMESRTPGRGADDASVKSPDPGGQTILNSELEIIKSLDLVDKVVDAIGVGRFVHLQNDGTDRDRAIVLVSEGFQAEVPLHSSVLQMQFSSPDVTIVQPVLQEFINFYLKKHVEIHRSSGLVDDFLAQETEQLRSRLSQTEEELRKANGKLGFPSIEEAKKSLTTLSSRLRQDIFEAETELAERSAFLATLASTKPDAPDAPNQSAVPPDSVIESYGAVTARIEFLHKAEQELLSQFTPENNRVKETRAQLAEALDAKKKLEEDYPALSILRASSPVPNASQRLPTADLVVETARAKALQSKINALNAQLDKLKVEASTVEQMEGEIVELNRKKELEETNYRKYAASLEQARLDEAMSSGHVSNISEIQSPSMPLEAESKRIQIILGLGFGGLAIGIAWAFCIELFLDKTIKRSFEIERKLNLPLFLTIPVVNKAFTKRSEQKRLSGTTSQPDAVDQRLSVNEPVASDHLAHALQHYHATLRDRLIQYFDNQNLTHKPKMVAVTGFSDSSGVTTTAAGLAQSLSETGEGNVLLVDMTAEQGSAQHYIKGKAVSNLEETLQTKARALVQDNLYVVTEGSNSDRLSRNLPQRFTKLVPKLKASDFDYIIFDMPPLGQISVTPRLAGLMDMVLLVVESEKTTPEAVEKASALLAQSRVHVGVVLNKTQSYVPKFLRNDPLGEA